MKKEIKKDSGSFLNFVPILITLVVMSAMLIVYSSWVKNLEGKSQVDIIARNYLLQMETEGYLTQSARDNLLADLEEIGMINISLTGTTLTEVGYGNQIHLKIQGELIILDYQYLDIFILDKETNTIDISTSLTSTAKH